MADQGCRQYEVKGQAIGQYVVAGQGCGQYAVRCSNKARQCVEEGQCSVYLKGRAKSSM